MFHLLAHLYLAMVNHGNLHNYTMLYYGRVWEYHGTKWLWLSPGATPYSLVMCSTQPIYNSQQRNSAIISSTGAAPDWVASCSAQAVYNEADPSPGDGMY